MNNVKLLFYVILFFLNFINFAYSFDEKKIQKDELEKKYIENYNKFKSIDISKIIIFNFYHKNKLDGIRAVIENKKDVNFLINNIDTNKIYKRRQVLWYFVYYFICLNQENKVLAKGKLRFNDHRNDKTHIKILILKKPANFKNNEIFYNDEGGEERYFFDEYKNINGIDLQSWSVFTKGWKEKLLPYIDIAATNIKKKSDFKNNIPKLDRKGIMGSS